MPIKTAEIREPKDLPEIAEEYLPAVPGPGGKGHVLLSRGDKRPPWQQLQYRDENHWKKEGSRMPPTEMDLPIRAPHKSKFN